MKSTKNIDMIQAQFDAERFRAQGHQIVDMLADYLKGITSSEIETVLPKTGPDRMMSVWNTDFSERGDGEWQGDIARLVEMSNHLHHPKYMGHQCAATLPYSSLLEMVGALLNNGSAVYEMGPVNVIMEKKLIEWMSTLIGYGASGDGIFTSGGTLGNLTALLAARQKMSESNVWMDGVFQERNATLIVSDQSHYSISRAASIMGLGEHSVHSVPVNNAYRMELADVRRCLQEMRNRGRHPFVLIANACSTSTGTYDNLNELADFCEENGIWFHVDGAHGASILLSDKYKHVLSGVERSDSFVWDAHKMLLMPSLITAVLFRKGKSSYETFSQKAAYLFESKAEDEWFNYAHRTMECTKKMMGMKLYLSLKNSGTEVFTQHVEYTFELALAFGQMLKRDERFELATEPQSNIVCFRYLKPDTDGVELNTLQKNIRKEILDSEKFYIVQTDLKGKTWLRCALMNPMSTIEDLEALLAMIVRISEEL